MDGLTVKQAAAHLTTCHDECGAAAFYVGTLEQADENAEPIDGAPLLTAKGRKLRVGKDVRRMFAEAPPAVKERPGLVVWSYYDAEKDVSYAGFAQGAVPALAEEAN